MLPDGPPPTDGWPTTYLLHSYAGDLFSWLLHASDSGLFRSTATVLVFPESGRRWFINDSGGRRYADHLVTELIPAVEGRFPCRRSRDARAIGGFSMGGAAAVYLALVHPDRFGSAFSYGGAFYASDRVGDPYAGLRDVGCMMPTEEEHNRVWGPPGSEVRRQYDPDLLLHRARSHRQRPAIGIEVGLQDHSRVLAQNRRMHQALTAAGLTHGYAERPGDHSWPSAVAAMERLLPAAAPAPARSLR